MCYCALSVCLLMFIIDVYLVAIDLYVFVYIAYYCFCFIELHWRAENSCYRCFIANLTDSGYFSPRK